MTLSPEQHDEIEQLRLQQNVTRRAVSPALEDVLFEAIPVLDHGFVRVIDYMGNDQSIVQAARVSYGKGTKQVSEDRGLIRYLMRHRHSTPFEMCEIKLHVKLPMFVARQWIRHRTANVNEYSARYSVLDREFYIPHEDQLAQQSTQNHQGRGESMPAQHAHKILEILKEDATRSYDHYEWMISQEDDHPGLARELARMNLPVNFYTQWYWKVDLHNLMHFLSLRADSHAQYEIRVYADVILEMLKKWVPFTYEAFDEYRLNGTHLSKTGLDVVRKMIAGEEMSPESAGLSPREWRELMAKLKT